MTDQTDFHRRDFLRLLTVLPWSALLRKQEEKESLRWKVGIGRRIITPKTKVWLAGYGYKRIPYGKVHDLYVKVVALKDASGSVVVLATTDHQGMSKTVYESIYQKVYQLFGVVRKRFMLTFSHNHSGPRLTEDLQDYYPVDESQEQLVDEYSDWMGDQIAEAVGEALDNWQDAYLYESTGTCTFAVNRRENVESEVEEIRATGQKLKGPVDHDVPVLAIKGSSGNLIAVLFGYACHPTTISYNTWSGDYPGFAQINLEKAYPGMAAMFFNACGGDQNPIPRRSMAYCKKYGSMLAQAVEAVLSGNMEPIRSHIGTGFEYVALKYEELATRETLLPIANGDRKLSARWARRMLKRLEEGVVFESHYDYPVQAWMLGKELLFIGIGGEAVVDYSLRFKKEYNQQTTWVCGYANQMAAYIPSRRVWEEGGYEGGPHLDEYGHPAWRWAGDVEERIARTVRNVVTQARQ
ncbi:neutral/alkaline non-lysosomal ceramidase N-terminal domain-containing protein [Membranicola marinus]|uniref:Neutral/alkaline non-lysosomal ceramidase N-terminal domain-containing protein n=1 Tax=Membranihabitans marinus TaxID=1227546 RepID=A0A953LBQ9_9BACT|nr:neutral/alkaline non-lysosomal ceramidase N-terminal domain-containing protein [Membranihabitans marinus]MBY5956924.1 neutral/alkaline non-lysosomal ceramidase N-terminal domain-containing protein [Membranihabitans marinus]